jgi:hypothetical protein
MGLYTTDKDLEKLRAYFVGKTIASVDPPDADEAIAKFTMTDGSVFRLHATELGYWIEDAAGKNGYSSLNGLMTDYGHHIQNLMSKYNYDPPDAKIKVADNRLIVIAPDGKEFVGCLGKFSLQDTELVLQKKNWQKLGQAANIGDMWRMMFHKKDANGKVIRECKE